MNKSYLIVPVILLAVFGVLYSGAVKDMEAKAASQQLVADARKATEKKRKDEIDARAIADAKKRQEERDAAEQAKVEKKIRDYEDSMKALKAETTKFSVEADKSAKEAADLEVEISQARTDKEKLNRETFDLALSVEQTKIDRRNAEIEIQRMIEMVAKKLTDSSIVLPPPPPPLPTAKP